MPPTDTYKIQIEQIKNTEVDKSTKDLASRLVQLSAVIEKLERVMDKFIPAQENPAKGVVESVKTGIRIAESMEKVASKLTDLIHKLETEVTGMKHDVPSAIANALQVGRKAATEALGEKYPYAKETVDLLKELLTAYKRAESSETYKTGKDEVLDKIAVLVKELTKRDRDFAELSSDMQNAMKSVGMKAAVKEPPREAALDPRMRNEVELFGKTVRSMGTEFGKIKDELKDKIVVAVDLETSENIGKKIGKEAAVEFISQIAYKKGTLEDLASGKGEVKTIYVKPPKGVETGADYSRLIGNIGGIPPIDLQTLKEKGIEAEKAMAQLADDLKDAEVVVGHNIAKFDLQVLDQHFKRAGVKVDSAVDKFVDTLQVSQATFPERYGAEGAFKGFKPHALGSIEKDLEMAGAQFSGSLHDAAHDVEVLIALLKGFEKGTKEYEALQANLALKMRLLTKNIESTAKLSDEAAKVRESYKEVHDALLSESDATSEMVAEEHKYTNALRKASKAVGSMEVAGDPVKMRSALQAVQFKETVVGPAAGRQYYGYTGPEGVKSEKTLAHLGDLADSLNRLQDNIVKSLERGLTKGVEILRNKSGEAFQLGPGGREWELKLIDVRQLRRALADTFKEYSAPGSTAEELASAYKSAFIKTRTATPASVETMANAVMAEVGSLTKEQASTLGKNVEDLFHGIREKKVTPKDIQGRNDIESLYKTVALDLEATRSLNKEFIKRLALPAAKISPQGTPTFETKYGAEKALVNFATVTTGLEKLLDELKSLSAPALEVERYARGIAKVPLRSEAGSPEEKAAADLADEMLNRIITMGGRTEAKRGYARAVTLREVAKGTPIEEAKSAITALPFDELIMKAKELGVTALDVAKALDEVDFKNFYDMLDQLFQAGKTPYIERQAGNIHKFDRNLRDISGVVNDLLGLMPMIEPGRPLRVPYNESTLRVLSKPTEELKPEDQKKHIIEVGMLWQDLARQAEQLNEGLVKGKEYLGRPMATSIDLSDAASSELKQFNLEFGKRLQGIDRTMIGMSTADLRGLAPFKDFSSIQRQLSYMTSGFTGGLPEGEKFETPALMSERERQMIEGGKFGTAGYGLNVLTELRNTAGTFEDQIIIAGKLANAFTKITQRLVAPAAKYGEITDIESGVQRVSPQAARAVSRSEDEFKRTLVEVADQFQEVLGVPQKYKGRADIAEIGKEVENVMREHRGRTIEVQTAKLTEVFLNYFGRKLATRFGTKGVTVTPEKIPTEIKEYQDIAKAMAAGLKATVEPGAGLGYAKVPKTAGTMVSELISDAFGSMHTEQAPKELHDKLIESGNKFILEMFRDASKGLVTEEEARKNQELFERVSKVWVEKFQTPLPTGATGVKEIRELYADQFGAEKGATLQPIEARISARGIAKRGLMPEILEALINNLVGTTRGTTTLRNDIEDKALTSSEEGRKAINEALLAIGYEPFKDIEGIVKRIKTEKPKATEEEIRNFIKEYESQWNVYTEVLNEFGERVQSLVAPKFLQIVEEPHLYGEWTPKELEKGIKGARLDFQSFGAYMGVFGEGSSMMEELSKSTSLASQEGWELIKAFHMLDPKMKDLNKTIVQSLPTLGLKDIPKQFTDATASIEELKGTIFDLAQFPTAFRLKMPSTKPGEKEEELYVPGPSLRQTYREELMGRLAPTNVSRYLANLVSAANEVEDLVGAAQKGGAGLGTEFQQKYASNFRKELTTSLTSMVNRFKGMEQAPTPQNITFMEDAINKFKAALSETRDVAPVYQEGMATSERGALEEFITKQKGPKRFSNVMGRISDIIVGADPESLRREEGKIRGAMKAYEESGKTVTPPEFATPYYEGLKERAFGGDFGKMMGTFLKRTQERAKATTVFDVELEAGNLPEFAKNVGLNLSQSIEDALTTKLESLSRAKISYFRALGEEVFGKKKGVEQAFFQRVTPAITGKAVSAVTDKTDELRKLLEVLNQGKNKLGIPGLEELSDTLEKVTKKHAEYVSKAKQLGLPVLREGEIAVPEEMAKKVKVEGGNLAELIKKDQQTYVESIRYPFTGTLSVQPHVAKLMEDILPTGKFGKQSIAVPGVPQLDLPELKGVLDTLREFVGVSPRKNLAAETPTLMERRETAWMQGNQEEAAKLTEAIKQMLTVIDAATPKFLDMEQKLDFDGDALFVHTGQLQSSRDEIKKHYDMLGDDVTSVRSLFRSVFSAVKETDVASLAEMATVFGKKHPAEKGFEFLTKPYIKEDVSNLKLDEVAKALFSYTPEAKEEDSAKAFGEWMARHLTTEVMPQVFGRMGTPEADRAGYMQRMQVTPEGLPQFEGATEVENRMSSLAEEILRSQLYQKKYSDAIAGQLYKLHTGQTVEGISRLARLSELETGFGTGLAGTGKAAPPSAEFLQRFPKESLALGGKPAEEFAVRVNEMLRFVIQKGMDVKHAGMQAVGQKIIENISKAGGVNTIKQAMTEMSDQFEELTDFNAQIGNEAKLRLGALSTEELRGELKRFQLGRMNYEEIKREFESGGGTIDTDAPRDVLVNTIVEAAKKADLGKNREQIVNEIIGYIDIYAVFEELFRQIKTQAVKGYSEQLKKEAEEMPMGPQKVRLLRDIESRGGAEKLAEEKISQEAASDAGISILKYVTSNLQPLYRMRTSMETIGTAGKRARSAVTPEEMMLPATEEGKRLATEFENITKASRSLGEALATPAGAQRGVYNSMVTTAIKQRYAEMEELQKLAQEAQPYASKFEYAFSDIVDANKLAVKVWTESKELAGVKGGGMIPPEDLEITAWIEQLMKAKKIAQDKLEEVAERAGLPPMMPEEQSMLAAEFEKTHGTKAADMIKELLESRALAKGEKIVPEDIAARTNDIYEQVQDIIKFQVSMVEQFKRINEMIKTIPTQMAYMRGAFPDFEGVTGQTRTAAEAAQEIKNNADLLEEYWAKQKHASKTVSQAIENKIKETPAVSADDLQKVAAKSADEISKAVEASVIDRKRRAIQYLETLSKGADTGVGGGEPAYKVYSASGAHGGGMFGGGTQQEGILRTMLGLQTAPMLAEATAFRGGAIHRNIQKEFVNKFPGAEIEKAVEDVENKIVGSLDVVYEEAGQKMVADIKTIYSTSAFDRLKEIADEVAQRKITIQQKLEELKSQKITSDFEKDIVRRLEDYLSQVNIYLKNVEGAAGKILVVSQLDPNQRFEIPIGKFDPIRFDKDIAEINKAKETIARIVAAVAEGRDVSSELESLKDMSGLYDELSTKLKELGSEKFLSTLPTRSKGTGAAQRSSEEVINRLTEEQQKRYDELSAEYLNATKGMIDRGLLERGESYAQWYAKQPGGAAGAGGAGGAGMGGGAGAPPAPPGGGLPPAGAGGGGDDYFEELRKRVEAALGKMNRGGEPNVEEITRLVQTYKDALEAADAERLINEDLAKSFESLAMSIKAGIEQTGDSFEAFERVSQLIKNAEKAASSMSAGGPADFESFRKADIERIKPERPEAIHKNLRAMLESSVKYYRLGDTADIKKYGPQIEELLTGASEKGPIPEITQKLSDALSKLPAEQKGGMRRVWMMYKKAVGEYFLKRLDELKTQIEQEGDSPAGRKAYAEYEQVVDKYLKNIRTTLTKMSDIYTKVGPSGAKSEFVEPELARLTGLYRNPQDLTAQIKHDYAMAKETQPVLDTLVGDLDVTKLDEMATPIDKARLAFKALTAEQENLKPLLADMELFKRIGIDAIKAWDFGKLARGITDLRAGMQAFHRLNISGFGGLGEGYTENLQKNVQDTIKLLKQLENSVSMGQTKASEYGLAPVPQFLDVESQRLLHRRNVAQLKQTFQTAAGEGGPAKGTAFTYKSRIIDPSTKQEVENTRYEFQKFGDTLDSVGKQVGLFSQSYEDMIKNFQERKGIGQAFRRVIMWGIASKTVYGLTSALGNVVTTIGQVETGMAYLRQVMSPLTTDFDHMQTSAIQFAKQFGTSIQSVIEGMKVYAQQGLTQREVLDRTYASMLAVNVTTLKSGDATEALTAAMNAYGTEGESAMRFLDSWTEVEARFAVTTKDLADAMRKSASAAKTMGVSFDELNALITGIGETTRMTGSEIGTALRFITRRMQTEKAPKALAQIGVPVVGGGGELRGAFDILGDLAGQWDKLTSAQKVSIAESIGGIRHYNALIVLMDHWGDVLNALQSSMDSKGAAERRNAIIMDTYAKKMAQLQAAVGELQVQFGQAFLPVAKTFIDVLRTLVEAFNNIPPWVKAAATSLAGFFVVLSKGEEIMKFFRETFGGAGSIIGDAMDEAKLEFKKGLYEISGITAEGFDVRGLKKFSEATHMGEMHSIMGKTVYALAPFGRAWNNFLTDIFRTSSVTVDGVSDVFEKMADGLFNISDKISASSLIAGPLAGLAKGVSAGFAGFGAAADVAGYGLDKVAQLMGFTAQQTAKLTSENTELLGTFGPLVGSFFVLEPLLSKAWSGFKRLAVSGKDYEVSLADVRRNQSEELATIRNIRNEYGKLEKRLENVRKEQTPEGREQAITEGTYVDPYIEIGRVTEDARKQTNALADANKNLTLSYDQFGNAVLKSTDNLKSFVDTAEKATIGEMFRTQVDILKKHIEDLTDVGMGEGVKRELKRFLGEIPGFGPQLSKFVHVSPAKVMEEERDKMNELLSARAAFPLTGGFDKAIEKRGESLKKAREDMQASYKDFRRVLAELPTEGLGREEIVSALTSPELKKGYEFIANIEPKLKFDRTYADRQLSGFFNTLFMNTEKVVAKGAGPQDIMGVEVMKRLFPKQTFDYTRELTKGLLLQAGIKPRTVGETARTGEKVFFTDKVSEEFQVAANQGVLNIEQTADGFMKATVTIFDKATSQIREVPYEQISKYVESIFPMANIQKELTENVDSLKEFLTGAEAGLMGLGAKQFKKDFNLGARFFSQVPTTTLVQSNKGYEPGVGFGEIPFKAQWPKILDEYFFQPMKEYGLMIKNLEKVELGDVTLDESTLRQLEKYQEIIQNNQVVVQYMAVYEDLNKTLAESTRVLEENVAAEKTRFELLTQTAGLLRGLPADLKDVDLGVQNFTDLTAQQRMAFKERGLPPERQSYLNTVKAIRETEMRREAAVTRVTDMRKAIVGIRNIAEVAKGMGVALEPGQMEEYAKNIAIAGDKNTGMMITQFSELNKTATHQDVTLGEILGVLKGEENVVTQEQLSGWNVEVYQLKAIDMEKRRLEAIKSGNVELALVMEKNLQTMTEAATRRFGPENVLERMSPTTIMGQAGKYLEKTLAPTLHNMTNAPFMATEYTRRAMGVSNTKEFIAAMEKVQPGISETPEFKRLLELQEKANQLSIADNKTLQQILSVYSITQVLQKRGAERVVEGINLEIDKLEEMKRAAAPGTDTGTIDAQLEKLRGELGTATEKAQISMFKQLIGPMALASEEFLKQLGMSERTIKYIGVGAAAAYGGAKVYEMATGEKVPEKMQKAFEAVQEKAQKGFFSRTISDIGRAFRFEPKPEDELAKVMEEEQKATGEKPILSKDEIKKVEDAIKKSGEEAKKGKGPGDLFRQISEDFRKAREDRAKTAADKLLNETQDQTGILLSINEKVGKMADVTIDASKATHGVMKEQHEADQERTDQINAQTQVIRSDYLRKHGGAGAIGLTAGALTVAGLTGYIKNVTQMRNVINTLAGNASQMANQMEEINVKYRGPIIQAIKNRQMEVAKAAGATEEQMQRISQTLDTREWADIITKKIEEQIKTGEAEASALSSSIESFKRFINEVPEKIAKSMEEAILKGFTEAFSYSTRLGVTGMGAYAAGGFEAGGVPEIPRPKGIEELSGLEAAVALARQRGNPVLEEEILAYRQLYTRRQEQLGILDKNNMELLNLYTNMKALESTGKENTSEFGELAIKADQYLEANKKIRTEIDKSAQAMNKLSSVLAVDVFGNLLQSFRKMKESFMDTEFMENFREVVGRSFDMMLGGKHPMAPQWPTYDLLKAGVPEKDLFKMNKYDMEMNALISSGKMISAEDVARIEFNKKLAMMQYDQSKEDEKLNRQRAASEKMMGDLTEARRGVLRMPEGEERNLALNRVDKLIQEVGVTSRAMTDVIAEEEQPGGYTIKRYRGQDLEDRGKSVEAVLSVYGINEQQLQEIQKSNYLLTNIEKAIREAFGDKIKTPYKPYETPDEKRAREMADEAMTKANMESREESRFAGVIPKQAGEFGVKDTYEMPQIFDVLGNIPQLFKTKEKEVLPYEAPEPTFFELFKQNLTDLLGMQWDAIKVGVEEANRPFKEIIDTVTTVNDAITTLNVKAIEEIQNVGAAAKAALEQFFSGTVSAVGPFQSGGTITGPGGPREDKVPILASPGEFIVNASASKKLGKDVLNYMNTTGQVPGMRRGGGIPRLADGGDPLDYFKNPDELAPPGVDPWTYNPNETDREKALREAILRGPDKPLNAQTGIGRGMETLGNFVDNIYGYWSGRDPDNFMLPQIANWSKEEEMEFARKNPNLYAATATAASFLPGGKFAYSPTDVEEFNASSRGEKLAGVVGEAPGKVFGAGMAITKVAKYAIKRAAMQSAKRASRVVKNTDEIVSTFNDIMKKHDMKATIDEGSFADFYKSGGSHEMALDAVKQIDEVATRQGPENLYFTKLKMSKLKGSEAGLYNVPDKNQLKGAAGTIELSKSYFSHPFIAKMDSLIDRVMKKSGIKPFGAVVGKGESEAAAIMSHELGGHAYEYGLVKRAKELLYTADSAKTTAFLRSPAGAAFRTAFTTLMSTNAGKGVSSTLGKAASKFNRLSGKNLGKAPSLYAGKEGEGFAEIMQSAYHTPEGMAVESVQRMKKALGITYCGGGEIRKRYQEGGFTNPITWWWKKLVGTASPEGVTPSAPEGARRIEEDKKKKQDIMKELFGAQSGRMVEPFSAMAEKARKAAGTGTEAPILPEKVREFIRGLAGDKKDKNTDKKLLGMAHGGNPSWSQFMDWYGEYAKKYGLSPEPFGKSGDYYKLAKMLKGNKKDDHTKLMEAANKAVSTFQGPATIGDVTASRLPSGQIYMGNTTQPAGPAMESLAGNVPTDIIKSPTGNFVQIGNDMFAYRKNDRSPWTLTNRPEIIPQYAMGTSYVPKDQIAEVHKGEAIIPAKYNMGGIVEMPRFQAGGGVDASRYVTDIGDQLGDAIVKKLEDVKLKLETTEVTAKLDQDKVELDTEAFEDLIDRLENTKIDFNIPDATDLPKLEIGNLAEVRTALERGVGAEAGQTKLDTFIDKVDSKLNQFDEKITANMDKITMLERADDSSKVEELVGLVDSINEKMDDVYTKTQYSIDSAAERSRTEARMQDLVSEIRSGDLTPIRSEISMIHYTLNDLVREVDENYDKLISLGNKIRM